MSLKSIVSELKGMKNGIGSISSKHWLCRSKSHTAPEVTPIEPIQQGQWASLPPELLLDIIRRVEESETSWPARAVVVFCASVCKSWRSITKEIVKSPQQCGRITFPISLKQPGPRDYPMKCFIWRNKRTSTFLLYFGVVPLEYKSHKFLLAAKRIRKAECIISLAADDFSQSSKNYVGKVRSNFWGSKFSIYDSQPPVNVAVQPNCRPSGILNSKQGSPKRVPACSHLVSTIFYEARTKMLRNIDCIMNSIPVSALQEGGNTPTPTSLPQIFDSRSPALKEKSPMTDSYNASLSEIPELSQSSVEPLTLINMSPTYYDDEIHCWGRGSMGYARVNMASVKNFQLVAAVHPSHNVSRAELKRVILWLGKFEKDIFIMEYSYPLSAFQAFAICITSMI